MKRLLKRSRLLVRLVGDARALWYALRRLEWLLERRRAIAVYVRGHDVRRLQLGAGPNLLDGWLNSDLYPRARGSVLVDVTARFPFEDESFDYVFSEHQIEHLSYQEGLFMLRECHRVLRPGGKARIATPDLANLLSLYTHELDEPRRRYIALIVERFVPEADMARPAFAINNAFYYWGHRFIYDEATLRAAMERAGFADVRRHFSGESDDQNLRGIESHGAGGDVELSRFDTLVLEGARRAWSRSR